MVSPFSCLYFVPQCFCRFLFVSNTICLLLLIIPLIKSFPSVDFFRMLVSYLIPTMVLVLLHDKAKANKCKWKQLFYERFSSCCSGCSSPWRRPVMRSTRHTAWRVLPGARNPALPVTGSLPKAPRCTTSSIRNSRCWPWKSESPSLVCQLLVIFGILFRVSSSACVLISDYQACIMGHQVRNLYIFF